jgi:trehalose/maltose transport system substrate-binding protein
MDPNRRLSELVDETMNVQLSRRSVLRRALALGLTAPVIGVLLAACGDDDDDDDGGAAATSTTAAPAATPTTGAAATPTAGEAGATSTTAGQSGQTTAYEFDKETPPPVPNAEAAKAFSGAKIVYFGDAVGPGAIAGELAAARFTEETGIEVEVIPRPESATESYSQYQRTFQGQSADLDCGMIDVIWPGAFAPHLVDLSDAFADTLGDYYESIVTNNTIDDSLVGIPWFGDFGMLFYRTDLVEKYGFAGPPQTWDELEEQAQAIMEGEQGEGNAEFQGFVWQGNAYEGLTCDALEWIYSQGGGMIVEEGEVTIENDNAIAALERAQKWVGGISPEGVTGYQEEDARNLFQAGNAAFMRNWPYAYSAGQAADSPIAGKFDVTPLPAQEGSDHCGTVGGWQLMVSKYSENPEAATEFVKYMASAEMLKWRAINYSFVPTMASVSEDPQVIEAMPFLATMADVTRVTRPSREAGLDYNELSTAIFQGVNEILTGGDAADIVGDIAADIEDIIG